MYTVHCILYIFFGAPMKNAMYRKPKTIQQFDLKSHHGEKSLFNIFGSEYL